jgi:hypothetical protein
MAFTTGRRWSFQIPGETIVLAPVGDGGGGPTGRLSPVEGGWAIETLASGASGKDAIVRRELASVLSSVEGSADTSRMTFEALRAAVAEAVRRERLLAFRTSAPTAVEQIRKVEVLGPETTPEEVQDVFLLAAEVKLIGDTPLINHAVRVLDPDTGEVVTEATTDEKGIVRTEVPKKKTYRIEIVDHDPDVHAWNTVHAPHPMLRCRFVDAAGAPVPHLDVTVKDLEGNTTEAAADEKGYLEMPAHLGLFKVIVGDDAHWVHSLLHRDDENDAYEIVVASQLEEGGDGIDPDDRLTRSWADPEDEGEDDGDYV